MIRFHEDIKSTIHGESAFLYNLEDNHFIKIQKDGLNFLKEFIEGNGDGKDILAALDEKKYRKFMDFLNYLKEKKYLLEGTPEYGRQKKYSKQEFLAERRGAYYEVTHRCNLKCKFCYVNPQLVQGQIEGDFTLSKRIIDKGRELGVVHLAVSGGEPLIRKDIFNILTYAKQRMERVVMVTNGVLIDQTAARKLKETGVDTVSISVESSRKDIHESLRGKGTFKKILKAIDWLKRAGFDKKSLNITATITQKNAHVLHEFPQFAEDLGVNMSFSSFQPVGRGKLHNDLALTTKQFFKFILGWNGNQIKEMMKYMEEMNNHPVNTEDFKRVVPFLRRGCGIVEKSLAVKSNGDLVPCHLFFSADDPGMVIGNMKDESIADKLWNFYLQKIPTVDEKEGCKECSVRYFCGGACFAPGYFKDGSLNTPHPYCERYKKFYSALTDCLGCQDEVERLRQTIGKYIND